jgi:N-methylhydantoinase B
MMGKGGAAWFFDPEIVPTNGLLSFEDNVYRGSTPIAGMCDPSTHAPDTNGKYFYFAREIPWKTRAGAMSRYLTNGGGGWGEVLDRDPARVLSDVRNGYVSIARARDIYKVVIVGEPETDPEGLRIDETATQSIRKNET